MAKSFKTDILPMFDKWQTQMIWRLDLTKYEDVKMNAEIIYEQIAGLNMPPPPYGPMADEDIKTFKEWMNDNFPE